MTKYLIKKHPLEKSPRGFTLIETIIYIFIFSILVTAMASFVSTIQNSRKYNQMILEVNDQGSRVSRLITSSIHSASAINSPNVSSTSTILSLAMASSTINPTVFSIGGAGVLYITEGTGSAVAVTNNKVLIKNLIFENYSQPVTSDVIKFSYLVENMATSSVIKYSNDFIGSGAVRR